LDYYVPPPYLPSSPKNQDELAQHKQWLPEGKYPQAFEVFQSYAQEKQNHLAQFTFSSFFTSKAGESKKTEHLLVTGTEKQPKAVFLQLAIFSPNACQEGIHQSVDYEAAIHWYQEAANLGHTISFLRH